MNRKQRTERRIALGKLSRLLGRTVPVSTWVYANCKGYSYINNGYLERVEGITIPPCLGRAIGGYITLWEKQIAKEGKGKKQC